jgi:hypothetical protein
MSTPSPDATPKPTDTLEQKVNSVLAQATKTEEGKLVIPDDVKKKLDETTLFAIKTEQRRRDTQAEFTRSRQALRAVEAERDSLKDTISQSATLEISSELQEELDQLQIEDPNAWRLKMNSLELEAKKASETKITEAITVAGETASKEFELENRVKVLDNFNATSDIQITQELIDEEIPPRITKKLENGDIDFAGFLNEVASYTRKNKIVGTEQVLAQPNLGEVGGGTVPIEAKAEKSLETVYANDTY